MRRIKNPIHIELSPNHERFLCFLCFAAAGTIGYYLTHFIST